MAEKLLTTKAIHVALDHLQGEISKSPLFTETAKEPSKIGGIMPNFIEAALRLSSDDGALVQIDKFPNTLSELATSMRNTTGVYCEAIDHRDSSELILVNPNANNAVAAKKLIIDATERALMKAAGIQGESLPRLDRSR